jgi:hypothetical protein
LQQPHPSPIRNIRSPRIEREHSGYVPCLHAPKYGTPNAQTCLRQITWIQKKLNKYVQFQVVVLDRRMTDKNMHMTYRDISNRRITDGKMMPGRKMTNMNMPNKKAPRKKSKK